MLALCCVSLTFSWFSYSQYEGNSMKYTKKLVLASSNATIDNYYYDAQTASYVQITEGSDAFYFELNNLAPGMSVAFRTDITNTKTTTSYSSLYVGGVECTSVLAPYVEIGVTSTSGGTIKSTSSYVIEDTDGDGTYDTAVFDEITLVDNFAIASGATISIYWSVYINEDAESDCMNSYLVIKTVRI